MNYHCIWSEYEGRFKCIQCGFTISTNAAKRNCPAYHDAAQLITNSTFSDKMPRPKMAGVGTNLKNLLGWIGIHSTHGCQCDKRAEYMDHQGVQWCQDNIDLIVSWLEDEAIRRSLPFNKFLAKRLIKVAIWRSK